MDRRPLDRDQFNGLKEDFYHDATDEKYYIVREQDASALVEANKALLAERSEWRKDTVTVSRLPYLQCLELQHIGIMGKGFQILDEAAFQVWLDNNPDFKATEGRF